MEHFGHKHPLILLTAGRSDKNCRICSKKIRGPSYACGSSCDDEFFIHKSCGELELEIDDHPLHPDHSLKLSEPVASSSMIHYHRCDGCRCRITGFFYHCQDCDFDLHPDCIYMSPSVHYEGHEHPLYLEEETKDRSLLCRACRQPIKIGTFVLRCVQCQFVRLHVQCGPEFHPHQLPPAVVYDKHVHYPRPLMLITTPSDLLREDDDNSHLLYCDACKKERNPRHPFYRCDECGYSAHVRCVVTEKHFDRESLKHVGHMHHLNFNDEIVENSDEGVSVSCDLCEKSVYPGSPTYRCATCKHSLHKSCGELPREIQHPLHLSHSLTLSWSLYTRRCNGCRFGIRRYSYGCQECKFDLHANCLYMSPSVRYEGHDHPLTLVEEITSGIECQACGYDIEGAFHLHCVECRISFHVHECGPNPQHQLPPTIMDYDKHLRDHPLLLITPDGDGDGDGVEEEDGFCDACKKGRNQRHPFYKCDAELCDYSAHAHCLITEKPFLREKLKHLGHKHFLDFHENYQVNNEILCDFCEKRVHHGTPASCCATCKFSLHKSCAEIQLKIQYPFYSHPLSLVRTFASARGCLACGGECNRYAYRCRDFDLHVECSSLQATMKYEFHEHPLIYFDKLLGKFDCSKCGDCTSNNPDTPYLRCVSCNFTIHFYCTPFPKFINHWSHHHPLKLMDDLVDFNYDDQICDVCETLRNDKECAYYCAECFYVAEFKCVFNEVLSFYLTCMSLWQSSSCAKCVVCGQVLQFIEKQPQDEKMMRIVNEGDPDEFTFKDVYDSLTEEEIQEKDHIEESVNNFMEEIWEPLPEKGVEGSVNISDKYAYSDKAMMRFFNRLYNNLQEKTPNVEFFSFSDRLVDVKVWGYTTTRKLVPVLKDLMDKHSYFDAELGNMSDNCKTLFITRLCGIVQSMRDTEVMKVEGNLLFQWWWQAKYVHCAGFNVEFLFDQLKRIVCANYGTDTEAYRNKKLYKLRKQIDDNSEKIQKLTKINEELMEETRSIIISGTHHRAGSDKDSTPSCLGDDIMSDLIRFRMRSSATGLL